jgi:hypothetical protein
MVPVLFIPPSWPEQVSVGREELEHFGEAAGGKFVLAADARALLEMDGLAGSPGSPLQCATRRVILPAIRKDA